MTHIHLLDQYQDGHSLIHRLDPRIKLIVTVAFILAVTTVPHGAWWSLLLLFLAEGLVIIISTVSPKLVLKRSAVAIPFALVAATLLFTVQGQPIISLKLGLWNTAITDRGAIAFASILTKAWLAVLMATVLSATTTFPDLLYAMRGLRIPGVIVSIVSFMYRYIFVVADEALRSHRAREARSAEPGRRIGRRLIWRAKVLGGMIGALFLRSYERSERIYAAMLSRGFDGRIRTMSAERLTPSQLLVLTAFLGYLLATVVLSIV
jgi:cobalt/nickel transport system permease protein